MASNSSRRQDGEAYILPQYGFGIDVRFENLIKDNRFLFRVYTPRERSSFSETTDPFFLAPKFDQRYHSPVEPLPSSQNLLNDYVHGATYEDVCRHMEWTTRSSSPYISTSFSLFWALWEALRRFHMGIKKDVEITVIDGHAIKDRAMTAVQLLRLSPPSDRKGKYWNWYRFAQESQSVLVYGSVPGTAVLASVPLLSVIERLPTYFLRDGLPRDLKQQQLAHIAWDYTDRKQGYRQFCQDMSNRFLQLPTEERLRVSTADAVRLALTLLRPWFHKSVAQDMPVAIDMLRNFSFLVARWPGKWWTEEHSEISDLIHSVVTSLAEEVRAKDRALAAEEVTKLHGVITQLEDTVKKYEVEMTSSRSKRASKHLTPLMIPPPLAPSVATNSPSPFTLVSSRPTPKTGNLITPPTSPIHSRHSTSGSDYISSSNVEDALCDAALKNEPLLDGETSLVLEPMTLLEPSCDAEKVILRPFSGMQEDATPQQNCPSSIVLSAASTNGSPEVVLDSIPGSASSSRPVSPIELPHLQSFVEGSQTELPIPLPLEEASAGPSPVSVEDRSTTRKTRSVLIVETASCLVTGFLFGAFITLCLFSPHRRTLITNLT